eukprot:CAMPEP_0174337494 /NCGR_PEP_ID=MMETSP0810-20121108/22352_1 /TAXON_ID=73025 ORGANISM="Eutreptiella gymnastica-like, Strain CCMP1594" /NCGR_SAMPLE_ID=MMETSP0810 /ASSEMBLY_ACC=CAM_ASM_000659 /LENGTH=94 /DNA_ID=CAMNT_0015456955 /DNA_START=69 /DNA_END=353 /DNA_ORIENTATION=-
MLHCQLDACSACFAMCQQSGVVSHWGTWDKGKASGHEEHTQGWVFGIEKRDTEGPLASQGLRGCKVQKEGYRRQGFGMQSVVNKGRVLGLREQG